MRALVNRVMPAVVLLTVLPAAALPDRAWHLQPAVTDTLEVVKTHPMVSGAEWVIMVTDRQTYIAGEHLWYSMHVTAPGTKGVRRSIAGYAELLNWSNIPVAQSRILLDSNGHGSGMLVLPDTLSSGDYLLRGYTRAMIPYGPEHYFSRLVRVLNPYVNKNIYTLINLGEHPGRHLELFTESGVAAPGSINRLVIKASGTDGKGRTVEVLINYPDGRPSDTVHTDITGLGSAQLLLPESGTLSATAVIDSVPAEAQLEISGQLLHSLALDYNDGSSIRVRIADPDRSAGETRWPLHLAVISPGRINYYRQIPGGTTDTSLDISTIETGRGIFKALLYDNDGRLLSSRLFMTDTPEGGCEASAGIMADPETDSVTITIPQGAEYVTLSVACDGGDNTEMRTWYMLEPWLTAAEVNDPFLIPFLTGRRPLSNELLITLGERSITSQEGIPARVVAETHGLAVTGTAMDLGTLRPASDMIFFINIPGKSTFLQYARSDASGSFSFIVPARTGSGEIVIYPQDTAANVILKISTPFSHNFLPLAYSTTKTSDLADAAAIRMSINSQVMRIYDIPDTDTLKLSPDPSAGENFYGSIGQHLRLSDYIPLPNMEEVFFELVPGFDLIRNSDRYSFLIFDPQTGKEVREPPLLFIDGTITTDPETIALLPPDRTESIDAIILRYRIGGLLLPPVICVATKKGDFRLQKLPQAALRINYLFTDTPLIYSTSTRNADNRIPVFRNTLLWFAAPCNGNAKDILLKVPRPDYDNMIRFNSVCFGNDHHPSFVSEQSNLYKR